RDWSSDVCSSDLRRVYAHQYDAPGTYQPAPRNQATGTPGFPPSPTHAVSTTQTAPHTSSPDPRWDETAPHTDSHQAHPQGLLPPILSRSWLCHPIDLQ